MGYEPQADFGTPAGDGDCIKVAAPDGGTSRTIVSFRLTSGVAGAPEVTARFAVVAGAGTGAGTTATTTCSEVTGARPSM